MLSLRFPKFRLLNVVFICLIIITLTQVAISTAQAEQKYCVQLEPFGERKLFDVKSGELLPKIMAYKYFDTYSPDGKFATFVTNNEDGESSLYLGSVETGNVILLHNDADEFFSADNVEGYWSPNSQYFAFEKREGDPYHPSLVIVKSDGTNPYEIEIPDIDLYRYLTDVMWSADSTYLAFGVLRVEGEREFFQLYVFSIGRMELITTDLHSFKSHIAAAPIAWSPNGHKLAFISDKGRLVIWSPENGIEVQAQQSSIETSFREWRLGYRMNRGSTTYSIPPPYYFWWSPDGQYLTISQQHAHWDRTLSLPFDIYLHEIFRTKDGKVMNIPHKYQNQLVAQWSNDNWLTMFDFNEWGELDSVFATVNVATGEYKILSQPEQYPFGERYYRRSPNRRYVAYIATKQEKEQQLGTSYQVAIYDVMTKRQKVFTQDSGYIPADRILSATYSGNIFWSPDEQYLATEWQHEDTDQPHQLVITKPDGTRKRIITTTGNWAWIGIDWLYNVKPVKDNYDIELINLQTGKVIPIAKTKEFLEDIIQMNVSPDGHSVAALVDHELHIVAVNTIKPMTIPYMVWESINDTRHYGYAYYLAWSPDGSMIAYSDDHLIIAAFDGKELHRLHLEQPESANGLALAWVLCPN